MVKFSFGHPILQIYQSKLPIFRFYQELSYKEEERKDNFIEECITDPSIRDKLSLVTRSFKNRIKVSPKYIVFS